MKRFLVAFVLGVVLTSNLIDMAFLAPQVYRAQEIVVHSGDTMWDIASRFSDEKEDVRDVIQRIVEHNKLASSTDIRAGQRITIPVKVEYSDHIMVASAKGLKPAN